MRFSAASKSAWLVSSSGFGIPAGVVMAQISARPPSTAMSAKTNEKKRPQSMRRFLSIAGGASANWKKTPKLPY